MVYEKKRSGDPDYDDKQPPEHHSGNVVTAGDGVFYSETAGFHDVNGAHMPPPEEDVDLDDMPGDNRPTPGNVASEASGVQQYTAEDTPTTTYAEYEEDAADEDKGKADEHKSPAATSTPPRQPAAKK